MVVVTKERTVIKRKAHLQKRRPRQETTPRIRKQAKDQKLQKRKASLVRNSSKVSDIKAVLLRINPTEDEVIVATRGIRYLTSTENNFQVEEVLSAGFIPFLVQVLNCNYFRSSTQIYESAWALTNIAATDYAKDVVSEGAIEPLVTLLRHYDPKVREQSAWCLGNIAGDGPHLRDQILNESAIESLVANVTNPENISLLGTIVWTISMLCKGKPAPPSSLLDGVIHPLVLLLDRPITDDIRIDILWAISYLSDGDNQQIKSLIASGVSRKLAQLLEEEFNCKKPIVQIFGNFVSGNDSQTQIVLESGMLNQLSKLLGSKSKEIRKESSRLASNIACGNHDQITKLVRRKKILYQIIENATHDRWDVRHEALWALANICTNGNQTHVLSLVRAGGFESLIAVLALENANIPLLVAVLSATKSIFEAHHPHHLTLFEECNGIEYLEALQNHKSEIIYEQVVALIQNYFGVEDEEVENLSPGENASCLYSFGFVERRSPSPKHFHRLFPSNAGEKKKGDSSSQYKTVLTLEENHRNNKENQTINNIE